MMFDQLFTLLKKEVSMSKMEYVLRYLSALVEVFDEEYLVDKNAKNAAIDCVIKILESHKDKT